MTRVPALPDDRPAADPSLLALTAPAVRVRFAIAYDGTDFSGWAVQPGRRTVQGELETALARIVREPIRLTVAGRTDAGVHARGQVAHADLASATWTVLAPTLVRRLAGVLPADVRVRSADTAPPGFDARFAALWRTYEYRLTDAPAGADPLRRHDTVAVPFVSRRLDENAMQTAATGLLGVHDFAGYCRYRVNATTVRGLQELTVARHDDVITITARADAFCHSMVRSLAGALVAVGTGRRPPPWPAELLGLTSRSSAVTVAPAHGLTLVAVGYPPDQDLAARTAITRNLRARPSP